MKSLSFHALDYGEEGFYVPRRTENKMKTAYTGTWCLETATVGLMAASLASITTNYRGISPTRVTCLIIRVKPSGWKGYSWLKERKPCIIEEKAFLKGPSYGSWFTEAKGTLQLDPGSSPGSHSYFVVWSQVTQSLLFQGKNIITVYKHEKISPYCSGYWAVQVQDDGRLYVSWGQAVGFDLLIDGIFSWCPHMA